MAAQGDAGAATQLGGQPRRLTRTVDVTPMERDDLTRPAQPDVPRGRLREVASLFLRLGVTAFGGPAAHVAMMEDQAVTRRRWLSRDRFLDLLGAANLLPGPSSSELAIYLGYVRAGWPGLAVGGACS